jgi:transcriptional/translational regulatory protein YebC/TACO1
VCEFVNQRKTLFIFFIENGNVIDPQYNAVLRATLEECRKNNMPKETIDRSIKRAVRFY